MLRRNYLISGLLHIGIGAWLLLVSQPSSSHLHQAYTKPIVTQIVSAKALAKQIAAVEPPVSKPIKRFTPPKKKPVEKRRPTTRRLATPKKIAQRPQKKSPPPIPKISAQDRAQFLEAALQAEDAAYQHTLQVEAQRIGNAIKRMVSAHWLIPVGRSHDLQCQVKIAVNDHGEVLQVSVLHSSGDTTFDRAAMSAVQQASPLPMPHDARFLSHFREIVLTLSPDGS